MKKLFTTVLLSMFFLVLYINPACAILELKKSKTDKIEASILDWVNFDWWRKQNDEYLESYITRAINNNHDIKAAKLKLEQANINTQLIRSNQLPQAQIGVSPFITKMPNTEKTSGSLALPLLASWELDLFGKNWDKTKSSKITAQSVQFQREVSDISIVSAVGGVYYNIVKLDKIIELQEKLVQNRKEIYDLMKVSNNEGIVSTSDLILSEKNYVLSQNDLIDYKKSRQNALNALAVLIGDSAENTKDYKRKSLDKLNFDFDIPSQISSDIIVNRPDYKALEKQLEAKGIDIRAAKKEFLPTIDILGLLSFAATNSSGMNWANSLALAGGSANLPVFTGFKRIANLKLAKNSYEQTLEQYQKTNLTAIQEVNDALYNLKSDKTKLDNNIKAYDIQNKDYIISSLKYNEGIISKLDLLQQQEALLYVAILQASSKADCLIDKISLYKATGAQV